MSHSRNKSDKNSLLINDQNNYSLNKDSYLFNINVFLLKAIYFNDYFNNFIKYFMSYYKIIFTIMIINK